MPAVYSIETSANNRLTTQRKIAEGLNSRLTDLLSVTAPSDDQLMALFWVSARVENQCFEVSEERTDSIFKVTDYGSRGC
jgi:hypothetical protein